MCRCNCDCKRERYPDGTLVQSKEERYDEDARITSPTEVEIGSDEFYAVVGRNLDLYPDDDEEMSE
jgi:hypothetical protein|tara:strand:+ start:136 stop:333 length:198 start_codon:yes stop_codon:yes gene_type:complete